MILYIPLNNAIHIHKQTVERSGGGTTGLINVEYLKTTLEFIENDVYYPKFEDKIIYLIWSINRKHAFIDGNKRLSITLAVQFLSLNGYLYCINRFLQEMENISYHLAAGRINEVLLRDIIISFLEGEDDFSEDIKLRLIDAISDQNIGFDEDI